MKEEWEKRRDFIYFLASCCVEWSFMLCNYEIILGDMLNNQSISFKYNLKLFIVKGNQRLT
jgi:hypothetical protein